MIVWGGFDNNVFWLKTGGISTRLRVETGDPVGVIYDAPSEVQLSDTTVVQPDISHFSKKRLVRLTEHGAEGAPHLVVTYHAKHQHTLARWGEFDSYRRQ